MRKSLLKALTTAMLISVVAVATNVVVMAGTITSSDTTVLSGNYEAANTIKNKPAENCTVTVAGDSATYEYLLTSTGTRTGLQITSLDTSNGKFKAADSTVTFTTDGPFNITMGKDSITKDVSGLTLTKSDNTSVTLTVTNGNKVSSATNVPAGTYTIKATTSNAYYMGSLKITVKATEVATFDDGIITVINDSSKGTVELTVDEDVIAVDSETNKTNSITGGKEVLFTVTSSDDYIVSATIEKGENSEDVALTDNSGSFVVDGNATLRISYIDKIKRSAIIENIVYNHTEESDEYFLATDSIATKAYYFDLTGNAELEAKKRININSNKGIQFNTGSYNGTATLTVKYQASGSSGERYLDVNENHCGEISSSTEEKTATLVLSPNTTYTIDSSNSGLYVTYISVEFAALEDATYTTTDGLVVVKDNIVYAIGKTNNTTPETVKLNVGEYQSDSQSVVYRNVCDSTGTDLLGESKADGFYYIGVKVNGVPNDAAAEALAASISIE